MGEKTNSVITGQSELMQGAKYLVQKEPLFQQIIDIIDEIPLRLRKDGFEAVLFSITAQQVSTASAAAIWARMQAADMITAEAVLKATNEELAALGLSRPKLRYAKALAEARIDYAALRDASNAQVIQILTEVTGIGRWSAEIYGLFALGRADIFPAGDLALQEAYKILFKLDKRPNEKLLREQALSWSPWRGVAARLLWAYYAVQKKRDGIN